MNIEGLGDALVGQLLEKKLVRTIPDLYSLKIEALTELDRVGPKSARNLLAGIESSKSRNLARFIFALGIRHVGERLAQTLAARFKSLDSLAAASLEELTLTEDIGPRVAESIVFFFAQPENRVFLDKLEKAGLKFAVEENTERPKPLEGQVFVISGRLEHFTRDEAGRRIIELGGKTVSTVSGQTTLLVAGESPGSKLDKARKMGIPVIGEKEFLELLKRR